MVFQVIVPIFIMLTLGYASVKLRLLTKEQVRTVGAFVLKISLPALLLQSLASKDLHEIWLPEFFLIYTFATLLMFAVAYWMVSSYFGNQRSHAAVLSLGAAMSNTGLIGTAVLSLVMGHTAMTYISLVVILESVLLIPAVLILAELGSKSGVSIRQIIYDTAMMLLKNPLFMSVILGISMAFIGIQLPQQLDQAFMMLGQTASPLALFSIGGGIVGMTLKYVDLQSCYLVLSNNILMPLLVFLGLSHLTHASTEMIFAGTIIAALPMPTIFGMLGIIYGVDDRAMTPLLMSTIVGFAVTATLIGILPM